MTRIGAVILAAGFGTRLAPLTDHTPKPLLHVGGQPIVSYLVNRLHELADLTEIVVMVNDQHPAQWQAWRAGLQPTNAGPPVRILSNGVTDEGSRTGAVADLATGVATLGPVDHIMVLAGDNLIEERLQPHLDASMRHGRPVVLCRDLGNDVPPGRFGEITVDASGVITRFREKPAEPDSPLAATCSYVLPGQIGDRLSEYLRGGDPDSPGSFVGWLAGRRPVAARPLTGRYFDIGNRETLAEARRHFD